MKMSEEAVVHGEEVSEDAGLEDPSASQREVGSVRKPIEYFQVRAFQGDIFKRKLV